MKKISNNWLTVERGGIDILSFALCSSPWFFLLAFLGLGECLYTYQRRKGERFSLLFLFLNFRWAGGQGEKTPVREGRIFRKSAPKELRERIERLTQPASH